MTSCDTPHVFLAFFASVAQCFKSALVVVFLLLYSVLPRSTNIFGFGFVFLADSGGELHFSGEGGRMGVRGWGKQACEGLVSVVTRGNETPRVPGRFHRLPYAVHLQVLLYPAWHRLAHRPGPRSAKPCPDSSDVA